MKSIVILGSTAPEIVKVLLACAAAAPEGLEIRGFIDDDEMRHGVDFMGLPIIGGSDLLADSLKDCLVVNNVAKTMAIRHRVWKRLESMGVRFYTAVHPRVDTAFTQIGDGVIIQEGAILGPEVRIGEQTQICPGVVISHESIIEDCCFLAPGVITAGRVRVKRGAFLGTGCVLMPNITVGEWSIIGAGALVKESVPPHTTVVGNPARAVRHHQTSR